MLGHSIRLGKLLLKLILGITAFLVIYFLVALVTSKITVNKDQSNQVKTESVYASTNGVHSDIIIPISLIDSAYLKNIYYLQGEQFLSLGWGDKNFYINTPEWADLTFKNAVTAMFWKSSTLMHVTRYQTKGKAWKLVPVSEGQLNALIENSFADFSLNSMQNYQMLEGQSYGANDNFYEANGSYYCFKTCNSWTNQVLKKSGLPASYWTPFDYGIMDKY
jgi:uncharacterized protein (TIGR02117 family)